MKSFVIVSNRLPVSVSKNNGKLSFDVSSGGLATAMSSLDVKDQIWVGWPGIALEELTASEKSQVTKELKKYNCYPVYLKAQQVADFYEGYANDTLWPLFHYFQSYTQYNDKYWKAYRDVDALFVKAVQRCSEPDATIWIQDYQLMLLPGSTRRVLPNVKIGFFLHIPFPSYEIFRLLPERTEILKGLLGADLLGFHIYDYAQHFLNSCSHLLGIGSENGVIDYEGRKIKVDAFPIGIDYKKFRTTLASRAVQDEIKSLSDTYAGQKLILSVDRLDYSKGIMKRLEAFDLFLKQHPEYIEKVTLMVVAVPSRTQVETYRELRDNIEQAISRINGVYATTHWSPISYQFKNLDFNSIVALYAKSDVAMVTPMRDGMNLVAKEYIASKKNTPGVLILSELAGAADELSESVYVNPNNITLLAKSIYTALKMPKKEQLRRLKIMQKRLSTYTVQAWGSDFIQELEKAAHDQGALRKELKVGETLEIMQDYQSAKKRLFLLDYDGTLRGFSKNISASGARPSVKLKNILRRLTTNPANNVVIISGRPRAILSQWFNDIPHIGLIAEHGAWMKQGRDWQCIAEKYDKQPIIDIMQQYTLRTAGSQIETKDFAVVWHYRSVTPELAYVRKRNLMRELEEATADTDLLVHKGNKIIEVKPRSINKGALAERIVRESQSDFIICAGDDYTDEDMFRALPSSAHSIKVGYGNTHARHQVSKLEQLVSVLDDLSRRH